MQNKTLQTHFYIILRFFDVLPNFHFIQIETMCYYYLQTWYSKMPHKLLKDLRLRTLGKWEISEKCLNFIESEPSVESSSQNENFINTSKNSAEK